MAVCALNDGIPEHNDAFDDWNQLAFEYQGFLSEVPLRAIDGSYFLRIEVLEMSLVPDPHAVPFKLFPQGCWSGSEEMHQSWKVYDFIIQAHSAIFDPAVEIIPNLQFFLSKVLGPLVEFEGIAHGW